MEFKGWETSVSLLMAYETLAHSHKMTMYHCERESGKTHPHFAYKNTFALLILNASIVEGTMRTIITENVKKNLDNAVIRGASEGRTEHDFSTQLIENFLIKLETEGSWSTLKDNYKNYYKKSIYSNMPDNVATGITSLMNLRNILTHGTALILPVDYAPEDETSDYAEKWLKKTSSIYNYMKTSLEGEDIFECLANPECPAHYIELTKEFFASATEEFSPISERAQETIDKLLTYNFGFVRHRF